MDDLFSENLETRELARVYISLVLAQDLTKRLANQQPGNQGLNGIIVTLDVTAELLEKILERAMPGEPQVNSNPSLCSEMEM